MPHADRALTARRGWAAITLALALGLLGAVQLPRSDAAASAPPATVAVAVAVTVTELVQVRDRPLSRPELAQPALPSPGAAVPPSPPADLCSGEGWRQRRGAAALASLRAGTERTGFTVSYQPGREGYLGLTHLEQRHIEIFVRSCDAQSDDLLRHVVAHELGHAYDTTHGTAAGRAAWMAARGIPAGTPWYGCSGCADFATPAGDFAEVYAQWARGATSNKSRLAGAPGPAELAGLAARFFGG